MGSIPYRNRILQAAELQNFDQQEVMVTQKSLTKTDLGSHGFLIPARDTSFLQEAEINALREGQGANKRKLSTPMYDPAGFLLPDLVVLKRRHEGNQAFSLTISGEGWNQLKSRCDPELEAGQQVRVCAVRVGGSLVLAFVRPAVENRSKGWRRTGVTGLKTTLTANYNPPEPPLIQMIDDAAELNNAPPNNNMAEDN